MFSALYKHVCIIYIIIKLGKKPRQNRNALKKRGGKKMIARGLVIVTYAICNAYLYILPDVIVSFHTGFDIHQMLRLVKGKAGKRFSTIIIIKKTHTHVPRVRVEKDRRHKKRNVKAYKHIMLISFVFNTTAFCSSTHE